ncbi:hypothetical protein U8607_13310 [Methylobacterium durans]|uniref:DUF6894 family protein n=1 Tax=Methylobacterium durans TaxID=2202825 RepID=UPI002AFE61B0|nr:hypothetical protein [Methylobacterium durans]MEA1833060.1 hypothetical protein [Methylobacterium durans]
MALYFFEVADPEFSIRDFDGTECTDGNAALEEALRTLCEVAADQPEKYNGRPLRIDVLDDAQRNVFSCEIQLTTTVHALNRLRSAA